MTKHAGDDGGRLRAGDVPALAELARGYFHEDLPAEYGDARAAVQAFSADASPEDRRQLEHDFARLTRAARHWPPDELTAFFTGELGAAWSPGSFDELVSLGTAYNSSPTMTEIVVLDGYTLNPGDLSWDGFKSFGQVTVHDRTPATDVVARAKGAAIVLTNKTPISAETLRELPALKYIGVLATGYNVVDVKAAKAQGVIVSNIPSYGTASVAQHAFALILELANQVKVHADAVAAGEWSSNADWCFTKTPLVELSEKTLGIVGFGRIGRQTAAIGHAMGMRVIAHDANEVDPPPYAGFRFAPLDDLLRSSDVVSLHCPLFPATQGLINRTSLSLMKPTAFLINTSRGPLIVDQDLADALNAGRLAGAGLDVLSVEPPPASNPLLGARNCLITPHTAWASREARSRLMQLAVENLAAFAGGKPTNVVSV